MEKVALKVIFKYVPNLNSVNNLLRCLTVYLLIPIELEMLVQMLPHPLFLQ